MTMRDFDRLELMNRLVMLEKEAGVEDAVTGLGRLVYRAPGILKRTARNVGSEVTEALAKDPRAPGAVAKGVGKVIQYTPHAAGALAAYKTVVPYGESKWDQFKAQQMETQPYFDPELQRYM